MEKRTIRINVRLWLLVMVSFVICEEYLEQMMLAFLLAGSGMCFILIYNFVQAVMRRRPVTYRIVVSWCIMMAVEKVILWEMRKIGWISSHRGFIGLGSHGMEYLLFLFMSCLCLIEVILLGFWQIWIKWKQKRRSL